MSPVAVARLSISASRSKRDQVEWVRAIVAGEQDSAPQIAGELGYSWSEVARRLRTALDVAGGRGRDLAAHPSGGALTHDVVSKNPVISPFRELSRCRFDDGSISNGIADGRRRAVTSSRPPSRPQRPPSVPPPSRGTWAGSRSRRCSPLPVTRWVCGGQLALTSESWR